MQNQNSIHCSASAACSNAFVQRHATDVTGILSGWDRMVVRGTLRKLYYARLHDEVTTDLKRRPEGMRIKHRAGKNTLKMYDKAGTVLRVETTINQSRDFKVYRTREGACLGEAPRNRSLRSGVADLHRRAQVSAAANERYLQALASVEAGQPLGELAQPVCRALVRDGRRYRGLRPWSGEDQRLLAIVSRGEFAIQGIRNRDVRRWLFGEDARDPVEKRRRSARVSRQLRLLRAHGILHKISGTQYYRLSDKGPPAA